MDQSSERHYQNRLRVPSVKWELGALAPYLPRNCFPVAVTVLRGALEPHRHPSRRQQHCQLRCSARRNGEVSGLVIVTADIKCRVHQKYNFAAFQSFFFFALTLTTTLQVLITVSKIM